MPSVRLIGLAIGIVLALAMTARGAGPAEALFRLVPPDAAATLAVEDLRGLARELVGSPVAEEFQRLPAFRAWLASDQFARFDEARRRIESILGEKVATVRDELFGDAVVLTLRVPPGGRPEEASGLLLTRVRDRPLLDRLIQGINAARSRSGELTRLRQSNRGGAPYWAREFRPGSQRPTDYFTVLDDNTFAWSNAEDLIQGVIDRRAGKARSLADEPEFQRVRRRLPEPAAASLFVDPPFLARVLAVSARPSRPIGDRAMALLGRYLGAMTFFGAAVRWHDGLLLNTEEVLDPGKLDPWVRRWAARTGEIGPDLRRVPANTLAMASLNLDLNAIVDILRDLVPTRRQPRLDNLILALDGVLLGHDLEAEILPRLGPGVLTYLEPPSGDEGLSKVLVVGLGDDAGTSAAVANGLQTFLAFYALDKRHGNGLLRVESRAVEGRKVTALNPTSPFAFAIDGDRLILGSTPDAVARGLDREAHSSEDEFERLRAARFPDAGSFSCVDLTRLHQYITGHRGPIAARLAERQGRSAEQAERDLDQAAALMALFQQAYLTVAIAPDATNVHRTVGLVRRPPAPTP